MYFVPGKSPDYGTTGAGTTQDPKIIWLIDPPRDHIRYSRVQTIAKQLGQHGYVEVWIRALDHPTTRCPEGYAPANRILVPPRGPNTLVPPRGPNTYQMAPLRGRGQNTQTPAAGGFGNHKPSTQRVATGPKPKYKTDLHITVFAKKPDEEIEHGDVFMIRDGTGWRIMTDNERKHGSRAIYFFKYDPEDKDGFQPPRHYPKGLLTEPPKQQQPVPQVLHSQRQPSQRQPPQGQLQSQYFNWLFQGQAQGQYSSPPGQPSKRQPPQRQPSQRPPPPQRQPPQRQPSQRQPPQGQSKGQFLGPPRVRQKPTR